MARRIGLKDIYVAVVTENTESTYATETPVRLFKGITAKINVKRTHEDVYSDDEIEETISALDTIEVEFEGGKVTLEHLAKILGGTYSNGMLVEGKDDIPTEIALGFRAKESNNKYEFTWLYTGKISGDDEESYETQGKTPSAKSKALKGTFYPRRKDGVFRVRVNEGELLAEHVDAQTAIGAWFSSVQEPLN